MILADFDAGNVLVWIVWIVAALACLGSGIAVVSFANPFYSALALIGNLALIAFARHSGSGAGQIFALTVMAVAASEVVVGLGLIVAMARRRLELDVDKLSTLRG